MNVTLKTQSKYNKIEKIGERFILTGEYTPYQKNGKERYHLLNAEDSLFSLANRYYKDLGKDNPKYFVQRIAHANNILNPLDISHLQNQYILIPDV